MRTFGKYSYYPDRDNMDVYDGSNSIGNLGGMLGMLNNTPPIPAFQFEIYYSKWPRSKFFAQDISAIGINNKTLDVYHAGFAIPLIVNTIYNGYELTMNILDDEFAVNYAFWRNAVILYGEIGMRGRPILEAFAPNEDGVYQGTSYIIVKQVNDPQSTSQHIWRFHNFKPTKISNVDFAQTKTEMSTFEVTGVFTHVTFVQEPDDKAALDDATTKQVVVQQAPVVQPPEPPEQPPLVAVGGLK